MKNQSGNEKCMKSFLKTKIAMLLLGLVMCLSLALGITLASPTATASAETALAPYPIIYIEGIENGKLNDGWYLGTDGYHTYMGDPSTGYVAKYKDGILTLNGYDGGAIGTNASAAGFYTVELIGENVITTTGQNGLYLTESTGARLTVTSATDGSLAINVTNESSVWGINAASEQYKNNVIIGGNAKVSIDVTSSGANMEADGIIANELTVEGEANLDITAKNTNSATNSHYWVKGIFAYSAVRLDTAGTINIDVTKAGSEDHYSYGILTMGEPSAFQLNKVGNMTIRWKRNERYGAPFSPKNPEFLQDHAINVDETNCFASYRFGKPYEVSVYNGTLTGPGVPNAKDTANFLAGDEVTLSSPDYTVSDTDTTVIPFAKWTADEGTITNQTTQNGAKYTLPSSPTKDVLQVKATHGAFTKTPEFERTVEGEGVITCNVFNDGVNNSGWFKLRSTANLEEDVYSSFYKADDLIYKSDTYASSVPAGEYVVVVDYNNVKFYSEPFIVDYTERKADVGDVTVFGEKGLKITDTDVLVTLTGYTFTSYINGNWITNLPSGLTQKLTRISDTEVKITVSGTPAAEVNEAIAVTIPKNNLVEAGKDITAVSNANAKFEIVAPLIAIPVPTPKPNVVYNGGVQWGFEEQSGTGFYLSEGYSAKNAGTYTAIAKLRSGYKWEDGTLEDKEIEWTIEQAEIRAYMFEFAPPAGSLVYDGEAKTASVTVRSYYESEGFTVTVKYQKDGAFVSDPTDAGTYTVYIDTSGTPNYKAGKDVTDSSWTFTIERAEQAAPEAATFTATAPTAEGASDGKITGVTEEMEYKEASSSAWTAVTGTEITGLAAGDYEIRFKQTDNYNASPSVSITIPDSGVATYTLTVGNGTGGGIIAEGDSVTITADEITGAEFVRWEITGLDTSGLDLTKAELTFTMPASDVTATALYSYIDYKVTVVGGTAQIDEDAEPTSEVLVTYECPVSIFADTAPAGKRFVRWTSEDGVVFDSETSDATSFEMPAKNVTVTAVFEDIDYTVTVTDGTADKTTAHYGDSVTITAYAAPAGQTFDRWEITGIDTASLDLTQAELTFTVGTADIAAKATYKYIDYTATVEGGTAYTDGDPAESITAKYGDFVNIVAEVPTGKRFVRWTSDSAEVVFDSETSDFTSFEMPASDVVVTAVFENIDYTVTVTDGTADKTTAHYGDTVSITAGEAAEGKVFDKWTCETAGITIEFASATSASTTFTMPAGDITVKANYRNEEEAPSFEIKVNGGTGAGTYKEGDSVTVTAAEPEEGKIFTGWKDADGNIVSTDMSYTFTVSGEVSLTAVYEDKPDGGETGGETDGETGGETGGNITPAPEKKGLGGGAIAGIVIASVAVAGLGGFAIFWFVIKKKSFAELIAAIKKPFTKK